MDPEGPHQESESMKKQTQKNKPQLRLLVGAWHLLKQTMGFGNPTAGGFATMAEALRAVARLNRELKGSHGIEFAVSGHWWHEILVNGCDHAVARAVNHSACFNNNRSIGLNPWMMGVKTGDFAPIGRIIPPGFGIPGADNGAFISPDPSRRELARNMMVLSFAASEMVKRNQCGMGNVIYWTGPDGIRWKRLVEGNDVRLGYELNPKLEEWRLIVDGLATAIREARAKGFTEETLFIETKSAGDPCYLDVCTDVHLAVRAIEEINGLVGAKATEWQGELCHDRGGGMPFYKAMKIAIRSGVFGGRIHFNAGGLGQTSFSKLLARRGGTPMSKFQQYVDNDFLPGEGVKEWLDDQRESLRVGAIWSARTGKPLEVEFDARFCRYADTIGALKKSAEWTIKTFNEVAEEMSAN
jgi:hypothetical protein